MKFFVQTISHTCPGHRPTQICILFRGIYDTSTQKMANSGQNGQKYCFLKLFGQNLKVCLKCVATKP